MTPSAYIGLAVVCAVLVWLVVIAVRAIRRSDLSLELSGSRSACQNVRALVEHSADSPNRADALGHVARADAHLAAATAAFAVKNRAQTIRCLDLCVAELRAARLAVQPDDPEEDDGSKQVTDL